jgi:hypothetical protein
MTGQMGEPAEAFKGVAAIGTASWDVMRGRYT